MKNFISKKWKNILLVIGGIFILLDLLVIITTPATIPQDFLEYGPDVESDVFDNINDSASEIEKIEISSGSNSGETSDLATNISEKTGIPPALSRGFLFFIVAFVIIIIISAVVEGSGGGDKKKK